MPAGLRPRFAFCSVLVVVTALAAAPAANAQILYAATSPDPAVQTFGGGMLYTIDPTSGASTLVGPIGFGPVKGISFDPIGGGLYAVASRSQQFAPVLLKIDTQTGAGTEVAPLTTCVSTGTSCATLPDDIAFRPDGVLFALYGESLATISIVDGTASFLGTTPLHGFGHAMTFTGNGLLEAGDAEHFLHQFDPAPPFTEPIAPFALGTSLNFFEGMALWPGATFLASASPCCIGLNPTLVSIDPATGNVSPIGPMVSGIRALAWSNPPPNTPIGAPTVQLAQTTMRFQNVTRSGNTTLTVSGAGPELPPGFAAGNPALYFDIGTTALFTGAVEVCVNYRGIGFANTSNLHLLHFDGAGFGDITTSLDTLGQVICGLTASFSPFVVAGVSDTTPPLIAPQVGGTLGAGGWYTSDVQVAWIVSDPDSPITASSGCGPALLTGDTAAQTYTCAATSGGGTHSESVTIRRDATPPRIMIASPAAGAVYALNQVVSASFACDDPGSGIASCAGSTVNGVALDTTTPGSRIMTVDAVDLAGNVSSQSVAYQVAAVACHYLTISANPLSVSQLALTTITAKLTSCAATPQVVSMAFTLSGPFMRGCAVGTADLFSTPPFTLPANKKQSVSFPFWVPASMCPGTYTLTATTSVARQVVDVFSGSLIVTARPHRP